MHEHGELVQASRRDIPRLAELWAHAFPGERTLEQRIRQLEAGGVYGGIDDAWYLQHEHRLGAAVRTYSLTQYLHATPMPMMGVAAVAVAPHARRQGLGAEICRQALRIGRARGDLVSVLYPFRPDFYYRLGWGLVGSLLGFRFRPDALPVSHPRCRVRLAELADRAPVRACYARAAARSHGLLERSDRMWEQHLAGGQRHLFVLPSGNDAAGYLLATYGRTRIPADRPLIVHELVADDDRAYAELLSWIALQRDQWAVARYDALPEERFDLLLTEPRAPRFRAARTLWAPVAQRLRGPMLRVLDVPGALRARTHWPQATSGNFTVRVHDPELPDNEGPWRVLCDGLRATCEAAAGPADLEINAPEFAQLYAGELSAAEAVRMGRATATDPDTIRRIDELFGGAPTVRLLDEF